MGYRSPMNTPATCNKKKISDSKTPLGCAPSSQGFFFFFFGRGFSLMGRLGCGFTRCNCRRVVWDLSRFGDSSKGILG